MHKHDMALKLIADLAGPEGEAHQRQQRAIEQERVIEARMLGKAVAAALPGLDSVSPIRDGQKALLLDVRNDATGKPVCELYAMPDGSLRQRRLNVETAQWHWDVDATDTFPAMATFRLEKCLKALLTAFTSSNREKAADRAEERVKQLEALQNAGRVCSQIHQELTELMEPLAALAAFTPENLRGEIQTVVAGVKKSVELVSAYTGQG